MKDSVTSGRPAQGHGGGVEASGSSGRPTIPKFKFGGSFMARDGGAKDVEKTAFMPKKTE